MAHLCVRVSWMLDYKLWAFVNRQILVLMVVFLLKKVGGNFFQLQHSVAYSSNNGGRDMQNTNETRWEQENSREKTV